MDFNSQFSILTDRGTTSLNV